MFNQKLENAKNKVKNFWKSHKEAIVTFGIGVVVGVVVDEVRYLGIENGGPISNGYRGLIVDRDGKHTETWILDHDGKRMTIGMDEPSKPLSGKAQLFFESEEHKNEETV